MKRFSTWLVVALIVAVMLTGCAPASQSTGAKVKVAMIMAVSADDMGWGTQAANGMNMVKSKFGAEIAVSENVTLANAEAVLTDYASRGFNPIISHGFQFDQAAVKVAEKHPNTWFVVTAAGVTGKNVASYNTKVQELGYLAGTLAASMSKSSKIAGFGGYDIPAVVMLMEGYRAGAIAAKPETQVSIQYMGTWDDVQKGKEAATALIAKGVDFFFHDASFAGSGMIDGAREKGAHAIGFPLDQNKLAPDTVVASAIQRYDNVMVRIVQDFLDKKLTGEIHSLGMSDGVFEMMYHGDAVPQAVRDQIAKAQKDIVDGKIKVPEITKPTQ